MANRKGVFIGAYVPNELKESLRRRAAAEHRTLSQEITRILTEAIHGRNLPAVASIDARQTRRRDVGAAIPSPVDAAMTCLTLPARESAVKVQPRERDQRRVRPREAN